MFNKGRINIFFDKKTEALVFPDLLQCHIKCKCSKISQNELFGNLRTFFNFFLTVYCNPFFHIVYVYCHTFRLDIKLLFLAEMRVRKWGAF